jgi:hypothetical protein
MNTPHGAWWETLFGTLPSRNRFAPVIPLFPTTIRSALLSSATSRIASAGSPSSRIGLRVDALLLGLSHGGVEDHVHVLAWPDGVGDVARQLRLLLAHPGLGNGLERSHDGELATGELRQPDRLSDRLARSV